MKSWMKFLSVSEEARQRWRRRRKRVFERGEDVILFYLDPIPDGMQADDRCCRACGSKTAFAVTAKGKGHTYPCCDNESCQAIVRDQITESLENKRTSVK